MLVTGRNKQRAANVVAEIERGGGTAAYRLTALDGATAARDLAAWAAEAGRRPCRHPRQQRRRRPGGTHGVRHRSRVTPTPARIVHLPATSIIHGCSITSNIPAQSVQLRVIPTRGLTLVRISATRPAGVPGSSSSRRRCHRMRSLWGAKRRHRLTRSYSTMISRANGRLSSRSDPKPCVGSPAARSASDFEHPGMAAYVDER